MSKVTTLTPGQEAELSQFRQKYLDIACGGARCDRGVLQAALNDAYAEIGKRGPKLFVFDSPAACMMAIEFFEMGARPDFQLGGQLGGQLDRPLHSHLYNQLYSQLRSDLYTHLYDQLRRDLRSQLYDQLCSQLGSQLHSQLRSQLRSQLYNQLYSQIYSQLRSQLRSQLYNQLCSQLCDQLRSQLYDQLRSQLVCDHRYLWGSHDLYWIAWAKFAERIGGEFTEQESRQLNIMERIASQCEWWWPFENIVFASQRPTTVKWNEARRLHCEDGPAVEYADGYSLFAWQGTQLPAKWVLERETIDPTEILREENVETRTAGAACVGWSRMLAALDYSVIDSDPDPERGEVIEIAPDKLGLREPGRFLKAECPRNGTIVEGLPREIDTVLAAQAWRVGLDPSEFSYPSVRT